MMKVAGSGSSSRWSLSGFTALIIGGTRGIGHAVVEELAELGATVYICSRNEVEINEQLQEWAAKGLQVKGSICDASSREQRIQLMENVSSAFDGKLQILINNVGTNIRNPTTNYTAEEYARLFATNLKSAYHLCQLSHLLLKGSGNGSLLENRTFLDGVISRTPLRRAGESQEVSSLAAYLCLPGASYITGQVIVVDGGFTVNGIEMPSF